jgi:peptidoglycan/LPS O-acetylase OafA/YrhL
MPPLRSNDADDDVSVAGHLGGTLAGVAVALVLGRNLVVEPWEAALSLAAALGILAAAVVPPVVDADLWIYAVALGAPAVCWLVPVAAHRWLGSGAADALPRVTAVGLRSQI